MMTYVLLLAAILENEMELVGASVGVAVSIGVEVVATKVVTVKLATTGIIDPVGPGENDVNPVVVFGFDVGVALGIETDVAGETVEFDEAEGMEPMVAVELPDDPVDSTPGVTVLLDVVAVFEANPVSIATEVVFALPVVVGVGATIEMTLPAISDTVDTTGLRMLVRLMRGGGTVARDEVDAKSVVEGISVVRIVVGVPEMVEVTLVASGVAVEVATSNEVLVSIVDVNLILLVELLFDSADEVAIEVGSLVDSEVASELVVVVARLVVPVETSDAVVDVSVELAEEEVEIVEVETSEVVI
jgi:hypothetical protein